MVKRRKFLIGAGALATGGSAALGTGATMYSVNDRKNSIDVVADNPSGVIGFDDTSPGDIVNETNGKIEIDFAERSGSDGVNVGSEILLGGLNGGDPTTNNYVYTPAFEVINQAAGTNFDYTVKYELTGSLNQNGSRLRFHLTQPGGSHYQSLLVAEGEEDYTSDSGNPVYELSVSDHGSGYVHSPLSNHAPGERLSFALYVDTDNPGSTTGEDLSGDLTLEATPAQPPTGTSE